MKKTLTPGKWRGLKATATNQHGFSILAFDQRGSFREMLPPETAYTTAAQIKSEVVRTLAPQTSAVLLDPVYGLQAALELPGSSGLLMALEKTGYSGNSTGRQVQFIPAWDVGKIKRMGASAVKLLVYYHPDAGELTQEIEAHIKQVSDACHQHDITLFVEPVSYSLDTGLSKNSPEFAGRRPEILKETARRLSKTGADVLKLEFPVDAQFNDNPDDWQRACEAISEVCEIPWALLSAGIHFETFVREVEIACKSGASGFLAGRTVWKECITMVADARQEFLRTTATERLQQLQEIVNNAARPWTDFYQPVAPAEDWFKSYSSLD